MRKKESVEGVGPNMANVCDLIEAGRPLTVDDMIRNSEEIEFILKVPRTMDPRIAELLQKRFSLFVEEDIKNVYLALRNAERHPAECK
jgi:hypothetical protein